MQEDNRVCQNCRVQFVVRSADIDFYTKIGVPYPTFCPRCRFLRRLSYRNERNFNRRTCNALGHSEALISMFHDPKITVYDSAFWWSDSWDPLGYGRQYDFSKTFFEQFRDLMWAVPLPALWSFSMENSDYANYSIQSKNAYLCCSAIAGSENVFYSSFIDASKDCADSLQASKVELGYELVNVWNCHRVHHLVKCRDCVNSSFLYDSVNCQDCFMSANLRNRQYVFRGEQLTKEEYEARLERERQGSYSCFVSLRREFDGVCRGALHRFATLRNVQDSTGDDLENCRNMRNVFFASNAENVMDSWRAMNYRDSADISAGGGGELVYECTVAGLQSSAMKFCHHVTGNEHVLYSAFCTSSQHLFGCVGLRNKEYCIFNRQYSKEAFEELRDQIVRHMDAMPYVDARGALYRYGEFFPLELSPFGYNESPAMEHERIAESEACALRVPWTLREEREYQITKRVEELADDVSDVPEAITREVISCAHARCAHQCSCAFRILPQEFALYRAIGVPLPRLCPNCRHFERLERRLPWSLWKRSCMCATNDKRLAIYDGHRNTAVHFHGEKVCSHVFETPYSPRRAEVVYCEECYQAEVF